MPAGREGITTTQDPMDASGHHGLLPGHVRELTSQWLTRWSAAGESAPEFLRLFSAAQQAEKEREIERILAKIPGSTKDDEGMEEEARARLRAKVRALIARSLSHSEGTSVGEFFAACERTAGEFVRRARSFDANLTEPDIHQALRNLWVFNSLQVYAAHPVTLSPSAFAYSMLYPYTDNWLDASGRSLHEKQAYLDRVSLRLEGVEPGSADEATVVLGSLIRMIEEEYPRERFPDVHASLRAIHRAQVESLQLHTVPDHECEHDLLALTITKGGTSVLADGFLVDGELSPSHTAAVFGYGVLLQLIDDLQDLHEDRECGHSTPFSRAARGTSLDAITNRLFHFMRGTVAIIERHCGSGRQWLPRLIEQSCTALIMEAIARYQALYSDEYLRMIEAHMPLHRVYFGVVRERLKSRYAGTPAGKDSVVVDGRVDAGGTGR